MKSFTRSNLAWLVFYLAVMGTTVWGLNVASKWSLREFATTGSQQNWDVWRNEAAQQAKGDGPVLRRVTKSPQPPTLVLMRDYYGLCVAVVIVFGSVLFFTFMMLLRGALTTRTIPNTTSEPSQVSS